MTPLEDLAAEGRHNWIYMMKALRCLAFTDNSDFGEMAMRFNNNWNEINTKIRNREYDDSGL